MRNYSKRDLIFCKFKKIAYLCTKPYLSMKFRTAVKLGVFSSVILFCIGIVLYGFLRLDSAGEERNVNLFKYVPKDCIGMFESDNVDYFMDDFSHMAYWSKLDTLRSAYYIKSLFNGVLNLAPTDSHGIGSYTRHVVVSFHDKEDPFQTVAYFKVSDSVKKHLAKVLSEKYDIQFNPKQESYRGQDITVYPVDAHHYMSIWNTDGVIVVSFQKRLIEKVIDVYKDGESLSEDEVFTSIPRPKTANYLKFYGRGAAIPTLAENQEGYWSDYNLHMNSEVFYLGGATYEPLRAEKTCVESMCSKHQTVFAKDSILLVCGESRVDSCISTLIAEDKYSLFNECATNLSRDAEGVMVVDMGKYDNEQMFRDYLPPFIHRFSNLFRPFIISSQAFDVNGVLHHIYIFTYKS